MSHKRALIFPKYDLSKRVIKPFVLRGVGLGLAFLAQVSVARTIGVKGYGYYALMILISQLLSRIIALGVTLDALRITVGNIDCNISSIYNEALRAMGERFTVVLVFGSIGLIVWYVTITYAVDLYYYVIVLSLASFSGSVLTVSRLRADILNGTGRVELAILPEQMVRPTVLILLTLLEFRTNSHIASATFYYYSGALSSYLIGMLIFSKASNRSVDSGAQRERREKGFQANEKTVSSWKLEGFSYLNSLQKSFDLIVLGFLATETQRGIYAACLRLANVVIAPIEACLPVAYRPISSEIGKPENLKNSVIRWSAIFLVVCTPILVVCYIYKMKLLLLFGEKFGSGCTILGILLVSRYVVSPLLLSRGLIVLQRRENLGLIVSAIFVFVAAGICIFGWAANGLTGFTTGAGVSLGVYYVSLYFCSFKYLPNWQKIRCESMRRI